MDDKDPAGSRSLPIFAFQAGETRFALDTAELIRCIRAASDAAIVPPVPAGWGSFPAELRDEAIPLDQASVLTNPATIEALVEDTCPHHGIHAYFVARLEQGGTLPLDLPTILQCLWLAQSQGAFYPLSTAWWNTIAMDHDLSWVMP